MIEINEGMNVVVDVIEEVNFFVFGLVNLMVVFCVVICKISRVRGVSGFFI